jgi:hypothetical protein
MAAAANWLEGTTTGIESSRERARRRTLKPVPDARDQHEESPFLAAGAADALVLAASALEDPGPRPVALILADGTVRSLQEDGTPDRSFVKGQLAGSGWTLWWERRRWAQA